MRRRWGWLLAVALLAATGWYGWSVLRGGFSARDKPSRAEVALARTARALAVPRDARRLANPQPLTPENLRDGMLHFADHCAVCHANNGSGDTDFGRNLYPRPPDMRGETQRLSNGELYFVIQNGVRLTGMPAFGAPGERDNAGTWNLVHFIRRLPNLTPEEESEMRRYNPVSRAQVEQEMAIERFLAGEGDAPAPRTEHTHPH